MKIRVLYSDGPRWEKYSFDEIDKIVFAPCAYFNVFLKNGICFGADKLDVSV